MDIRTIDDIATVNSNKVIIKDTASAVDFIIDIKYKTNCYKIALNKSAVTEDFFILSNDLAGKILQKFVNYNIRFTIFGDFSKYTSKPLKDFIYKSNQGKDAFFVKDMNEAVRMLKSKLYWTWQGFKDLILNPTKYMVSLGEFNVECAKSVLERHGIICYA